MDTEIMSRRWEQVADELTRETPAQAWLRRAGKVLDERPDLRADDEEMER